MKLEEGNFSEKGETCVCVWKEGRGRGMLKGVSMKLESRKSPPIPIKNNQCIVSVDTPRLFYNKA